MFSYVLTGAVRHQDRVLDRTRSATLLQLPLASEQGLVLDDLKACLDSALHLVEDVNTEEGEARIQRRKVRVQQHLPPVPADSEELDDEFRDHMEVPSSHKPPSPAVLPALFMFYSQLN